MKRQTLHYSFCQDLGNKKLIDVIWPEKVNFALFKIKQRMNLGGGRDIPGTEIFVPGYYEVKKLVDKDFENFFTSMTEEDSYQTFIAPADYAIPNSKGEQDLFYVREGKNNDKKPIKVDIKEEFLQLWKEQPHLIEHATFQFYFLNECLFSANLPFLRINENQQIEVDWKVRASPSGTFLFFRSGHIFFKWKIEVRQGIVNLNAVKATVDALKKTMNKVGGALIKGLSAGLISLDGTETEAMDKLAGSMVGGQDPWKKMGLDQERKGKVQEQHTERMFKSTYADAVNNVVEPSIFYSNTITFPYNLFDYWLRNEKDPFFIRIYYSNNLYNNLVHNNNENPITYPLNITFQKLGNILRKGYWQGKLTLDYDPGGNMAKAFARGVWFYEDKEKDFPNPKLDNKEMPDLVKYSGTGGDTYTAQTITEPEAWVVPINRPKGNPYHQRGHYFIFYEDGSTDHWLAMYPQGDIANDLPDGHTHEAFILEFDKPVKKMVDIYTCIGCGAQDTPLFEALNSSYRGGGNLETIHKGLPFEPWYSAMSAAVANEYKLTVSGKPGRLGSSGDVWEKATQEIPDKTFTKAYGFIPNSSTITWRLSGQSSKIKLQKVPGHDDFDGMDWTPPPGSGGDTDIPFTDPDVGVDPTKDPDGPMPEPDFVPDTDPSGPGEPEITPLEPDFTQDPDFFDPDFPEPDIPDIPLPEPEPPTSEPDATPDKGDKDPNDDEPEKPEDFD